MELNDLRWKIQNMNQGFIEESEMKSKCCWAKVRKCRHRQLGFVFYRCTNCKFICQVEEEQEKHDE